MKTNSYLWIYLFHTQYIGCIIVVMFQLIQIRHIRQELLISQQELATRARISLTTLQNIEAEIANPSFNCLKKIFRELGLNMNLNADNNCWDVLASLGLPITSKEKNFQIAKSRDNLVHYLKISARSITSGPKQENHSRKLEAIESLLVALRDHYPTFYQKRIKKVPLIDNLIPDEISGKHIKLRRLVLASIGEYF